MTFSASRFSSTHLRPDIADGSLRGVDVARFLFRQKNILGRLGFWVWKWIGKAINRWCIDWRVLVVDVLSDLSPAPKHLRLARLGPCPNTAHFRHLWRHSLPVWWRLAILGDPLILKWAQTADINYDEILPDGANFLFVAIMRGNMHAIRWGLLMGLDPSALTPRNENLLCLALKNGNFEAADMLLSFGASWYHMDRLGYSAEHLAQRFPSWQAYWDKRNIQKALPHSSTPSLITRKKM